MAVNVIVDGLHTGPLCLQGEGALPVSSIRRLVEDSFDHNGIKNVKFRLQMRSRVLEDDEVVECDQGDSFLTVNVVPSLQGGKGGFGALIRAMGKSVEKSQNKDACRDLSGRRVRDVQAEKKLTEWAKKDAQGKGSDEEERIKQLEQKLAQPKHMYSDPSYMSQIHSVSESMEDALKQGLKAGSSGLGQKRGTPSGASAAPKRPTKSMMWLGVEEVESEEEGEEDEGSHEQAAKLPPEGNPPVNNLDSNGVCPDPHSSEVSSSLVSPPACHPPQEDKREPSDPVQQSNCVTSSHGEGSCAVEQEHIGSGHNSEEQLSSTVIEEPHTSLGATTKCSQTGGEEDVNWTDFSSAHDLESLGRDKLKAVSVSLGLKCGGTLQQLAARVFSTVGKERQEWDPSILAKPTKR